MLHGDEAKREINILWGYFTVSESLLSLEAYI